jgi:hypothetical protein
MTFHQIILESGYNTDYLYSLISSLFLTQSFNFQPFYFNKINELCNQQNICYKHIYSIYFYNFIQEKFCYPIQNNNSIESKTINKLRLYLYELGWLKNNRSNILSKSHVVDLYKFITIDLFNIESNLIHHKITIVDSIKHIIDINNIANSYQFDINLNKTYISFFFDISYSTLSDSNVFVNLTESLKINDKIWLLTSFICKKNSDYYSIIKKGDAYIGLSDNKIPSNWIIDMHDLNIVIEIMKNIVMVFYTK